MSGGGELLVGLAMLVGLVGTVLPFLPGLPIIWGAGLVWVLSSDGSARWLVLAVLTVLLVAGTVAHYALPARSLGGRAPRSTLLLGALGAIVGMFVVPVVGFPLGGVVGVFLAESRRTGSGREAWESTRRVLVAFGIGMLVEVGAGVLMVLTWVVAALAI
ncbi:MAG TPA: DUF456 domain-containing protein [Frankiaceae bacterium]|nr:DUF456 domain-containing protein [Frankiaceae bacterium]